jgi:type IV secretion system protein VirD4
MQQPFQTQPLKQKRNTSLLGFLFLILTVIGINSLITQALAMHWEYSAALGKPIILGLYNPFAWNFWQFHYYQYAKPLFDLLDVCSLVAYFLILLISALIQGLLNRRAQVHEGLHGTAHWATQAEIQQSGLLPKIEQEGNGVYVGAWEDPKGRLHYLTHSGLEHVAALAPTRSGKGVGLVIPTLLSWKHSTVIHDMKGELWALTAGYRKQGLNNRVLKFDPAAPIGSCSFNPLSEVRLGGEYEVADVQNLVTILVDPDGKGLNDHWAKTAHAFLTGVTLHLLYRAKNANAPHAASLYDVAMALSDPSRDIKALYDEMLESPHIGDQIHPVVAAAARDMLNRPDTERGSVLSSAMSYLSLYRDPLVAKNTRRSDFCINDLMNHDQPVSLYLVVRPTDKDRLKPLMRLILNQIVRVLTRQEMTFKGGQAQKTYKHRLLLMLDEFPSFGRLEVFQEALAFIAGYGIKAYLIMQDISQLRAAYGQDESILSNCHIRVAYAPNKPETAEWLSKLTGNTTVTVEDYSTSGQRFGAVLTSVNHSYQAVSRPLMTPDECQRLAGPTKNPLTGEITKPGAMLIFVAGFAPIFGTQILYFTDALFKSRSAIDAPKDSERLAPVPNHQEETL